ncbi:CD225/dispanin family protein [Hymenobacter yonginensis]|uniref:CD225/dispanin family protein n=1 Tax=Hymenobacter yonginensis TaxID=748197 RepID=A0ABY7PPH5_9BACT|nr:CD225/dispanin family protein [Hymenobacter yonginensis]WBO83895.1 CD225/dispanin family protein [Hymenobacter yonginensis]
MEQSYTSPSGMSPLPPGPPPKNWLVESILVTIFCCLPFGIVAIINAANVNSRLALGDYNGALEASQKAGKWVKYSLIGWAVFAVLYVVFVVVMGVGAGMLGALNNQ